MKTVVTLTVIVSLCFIVKADVYMHNPRGSNNRLNEKSATRANNNRVFDSQVGQNILIYFNFLSRKVERF